MDNEALGEVEEVDVVALLAEQGLEDDNDEVDGLPDELPDDPDELKSLLNDYKERVGKRNKTIKKRTDANHRMQEELDAMRTQIEQLSNSTANASTMEAQNQEYKETHEKWRSGVEDGSLNPVDYADWQLKQTQDRMANFLADMQSNFDSRLEELAGNMNPERMKNREKINQLKANPKFASFSDDQILTVIQTAEAIKPRGNIGGQRVQAQPSAEKRKEELRELARKHFNGNLG